MTKCGPFARSLIVDLCYYAEQARCHILIRTYYYYISGGCSIKSWSFLITIVLCVTEEKWNVYCEYYLLCDIFYKCQHIWTISINITLNLVKVCVSPQRKPDDIICSGLTDFGDHFSAFAGIHFIPFQRIHLYAIYSSKVLCTPLAANIFKSDFEICYSLFQCQSKFQKVARPHVWFFILANSKKSEHDCSEDVELSKYHFVQRM